MNSTTEEFSNTRRSLLDELYPRGTLSSAKRKPYIPRKVMNLKPLNLDGIKKELEEGLEEEERQSIIANSKKCNENVPENDEICLADVEDEGSTKLKRTCEDQILKDISNNTETNKNAIEHVHGNLMEEDRNRNSDKANINVIPAVKENNAIRYGQKNNSFDIDFSALSLFTPVKKNEISFITSSANKNLKVVKSEHTTRNQFEGFVTPRVSNVVPKIQPGSISRASREDEILKDVSNNVESNKIIIEQPQKNLIEDNQNRNSDKANIKVIPAVKENNVVCYGKKNMCFDLETNRNKVTIKSADENLMGEKQNRISGDANINVISEVKENSAICYGQKNDSFDIDFSALSLVTPVKKNENSVITPSANKNLKIVKSEHTTREQFGGFVTPRVSNIVPKTQPSSINRASSRTSISYSTNKPSSNVLAPSTNAKEEPRNEQEHPSLANSTNGHKFSTIKVNNVEYVIVNILGRGGSSEVFQCYNAGSQRHVAIKCVSLQNSASAVGFINEVKLLHQLQECDKIIKMYDYEISESQKKLFVVLEKGGENLSTTLKQLAVQRCHIPMYLLLFYWMEMLYAVKQIHSHGVLHSDLKPSNFLKSEGGIKLIDFGIASSVQTDMTSVIKSTPEGSCDYISPEALIGDSSTNIGNQSSKPRYKIHFKSDVWSLGCILYQFVYRRTPFQHIKQMWPKLATIMNPDHKIDYPEAHWVSPKIITTIQKCLQYNVKSRPSVDELIAEYELILHNI